MNSAVVAALFGSAVILQAAEDILIADFEGTNYGNWKASGSAFGAAPAKGTLPGQMRVDGFQGRQLANSFVGGDKSTGTLTSPSFKIERPFISFLVGGGGFADETCMNLRIDGKVVRTATGPNTQSGGSEQLAPSAWDVKEFLGRDATIEIVDRATGGWGHINVDQIVQSDRKPPIEQRDVTRTLVLTKRYLHFPVKNGAPHKKVQVLQDGKVERFFDIELADGDPDWWAFLDMGVDATWQNKPITIQVNKLRDNSHALELISQDDEVRDQNKIYREALRAQFHFSARRGWINDPNGLVFYRGEYHLFFQHNPYGWNWGNMHWGHALSTDLVHWTERAEALYPDDMGTMFSGSAVVDWKNTSGFGKGDQPPIVLIYTAEGKLSSQCLAYSVDGGKTFAKFSDNPVVKQITRGNRDPKVFWHEPTKRWVMTLYVGFDEVKDGKKSTRHTIHFFTSTNLKEWTKTDEVDGFFECPDFFELPIDGNTNQTKWVLTAANSEYMLGAFDGKKFAPETRKLPGHRGRGYYAAQTFSDIPDGRRIEIGWLQAPSPGMAFNNCMSLPQQLELISTPDGPRVKRSVVNKPEFAWLHNTTAFKIEPGETKAVTGKSTQGSLMLYAEFEPGADSELKFEINGVPVTYSASKQELSVKEHRAPAPLRDGKQTLRVYADRTVLEIFASDGLTYVPFPAVWNTNSLGITASLKGAPLKSAKIGATELRSIWNQREP